MSMFDSFKEKAGELRDKAGELINENSDRIKDGLDRAGDFVDEKTGGRFSDQIDNVQAGAGGLVDKAAEATNSEPTGPADPVAPPPGNEPGTEPPAGNQQV